MSQQDQRNEVQAAPEFSGATDDPQVSANSARGSALRSGIWVFLILAGVIAMSKLPGTSVSIGHESPAQGKPAPSIDLMPLTDKSELARVDGLPSGKVVLLHFWGTWCGPCTLEYPYLSAMVKQWEPSNQFQFLPVSCKSNSLEPDENLRQKTQDYFDQTNIESYAYCDPYGLTRKSVAKRLERDGMYYPTTMLIQQDGSIAGVWEGFNEAGVDQMREAIGYLLHR